MKLWMMIMTGAILAVGGVGYSSSAFAQMSLQGYCEQQEPNECEILDMNMTAALKTFQNTLQKQQVGTIKYCYDQHLFFALVHRINQGGDRDWPEIYLEMVGYPDPNNGSKATPTTKLLHQQQRYGKDYTPTTEAANHGATDMCVRLVKTLHTN